FGNGSVSIASPQSYAFDFMSGGGPSIGPTCGPGSVNVFKKNPGVNGLTLRSGTTNPKPNVRVQLIGPTGSLVVSSTSDADGFYQLLYKHTGKAANFTVKLPDLGVQQVVTLKANGYALVLFDNLP